MIKIYNARECLNLISDELSNAFKKTKFYFNLKGDDLTISWKKGPSP